MNMNPTADSQVWNPFFFGDGDAALLLHCKIQQTTFMRIACLAQRKHFGPTELERVKENREENKPKQSRQSRQLSFTGPSDYCFSRNGCFGRVVDVAGFLVNETRAKHTSWNSGSHVL